MKENIIKKRRGLQKTIVLVNLVITLGLLIGFNSCKTIAYYDQYAYQETISLKYDALNLMDKGIGDYNSYQKDVEGITLRLDKLSEYEKGRDKNNITVQMWDIMKSSDKDLLGGFLKMWKDKGTLGKVFISEKKKQVEKGFDDIIVLESKKIKK